MHDPRSIYVEVLEQLDQAARDHKFLMLDNGYDYPAGARLSAYTDTERWALVIEGLVYHNRCHHHDAIQDVLYIFGDPLSKPPRTSNEDVLYPTGDPPAGRVFDDEYGWTVRAATTQMQIGGVLVPLDLSPQSMSSRGVDLEFSPAVGGHELLRSLVPSHSSLLFAHEKELLRRIPEGVPLVLRLHDWNHPDLASGEWPSKNETFQLISRVLETGNASLYQPTARPNTHWSNWPAGGAL